MDRGPSPHTFRSAEIRADVPQSARIWNYWQGGKDHYPVDREAGDEIKEIFPGIEAMALQGRAFRVRVIERLARQAGIRQFLDIGAGLPGQDNTHEVAQRIVADARIVYVDNDPLVLSHARARLISTPEGACGYVDADLRDTGLIVDQARRTLDFATPIGVLLCSIIPHIEDDDEAYGLVGRLVEALPPGSHVVITHDTADFGEAIVRAAEHFKDKGGPAVRLRSHAQVSRFFEGLDLLEPGVVSAPLWHPGPHPFTDPEDVPLYAGAARKPAPMTTAGEAPDGAAPKSADSLP